MWPTIHPDVFGDPGHVSHVREVTVAHATFPPLVLDLIRRGLEDEIRPTRWATPGDMAHTLDITTVQTPALDLIDARLADVAVGTLTRCIVNMPPQEGKSMRITRWFVLWMLHRNPNLRVAIISATFGLAGLSAEWIRNMIATHPELDLTLSRSTAAKHEFQLAGYRGGVYAVGIGGNLVGRPVDLMVIDDPYSSSGDADSKAWAKTVREFWTEVARPRLAPKAPVVLVQTRWREDDLAGWLSTDGGVGWDVLNIPAVADHDPTKGETDVLGREPGEFMISARGNEPDDWALKRVEVGSRAWTAQYQGRPSPVEGEFFKRSWWRQYDVAPWLQHDDGRRLVIGGFDKLMASWDMTFKGSDGADFVVGQVWMRRGPHIYLLDQVRRRMNFPETLAAVRRMHARWPQLGYHLVEDKANGSAVLASLQNETGKMIPEEPAGGKEARAAAVSPLVEAGNVWLPDPMLNADLDNDLRPFAWVGDFVEECAGFPTAKHDDQVDAMSQALNRLALQPLVSGGVVTAEDLDYDLDGYGDFLPSYD